MRRLNLKKKRKYKDFDAVGVANGIPTHSFNTKKFGIGCHQVYKKNAYVNAKIVIVEVDEEALNELYDLISNIAQVIVASNLAVGQKEL